MAENVGSSDIWSDGVEKSENCRTQTLPLTLLLQKRLLLAPQRSPLLLKRNSLFLLTLIPTNKKVAHSLRVGDLKYFC